MTPEQEQALAQEQALFLGLIGGAVIVEGLLPAGPGVDEDEVGEAGPWYGIRWADGETWGWARDALHIPVRHLVEEQMGSGLTDALIDALAERTAERDQLEDVLNTVMPGWRGVLKAGAALLEAHRSPGA